MSDKKQKGMFSPDIYHEMCQPFATQEDANAAISAFYDELYELRKKHKIPDVHCCIRVQIRELGSAMTDAHIGSEVHAESMTAYAFGRAQSDRQAMLAKLIAENTIPRGKRKGVSGY